MIKVTIQPKSGQLVTRTMITLLASAIDLVEGLAFSHTEDDLKHADNHAS
ncbi:hypothetical protein [Alkanindiges hydrocarboniclasticus]|jgi:hypothetical protein|nr:hypothetical protein [Alkanindiges hydrocarboniclasticus]